MPDVPHRKNAAEWMMWIALYPFFLLSPYAGRRRERGLDVVETKDESKTPLPSSPQRTGERGEE